MHSFTYVKVTCIISATVSNFGFISVNPKYFLRVQHLDPHRYPNPGNILVALVYKSVKFLSFSHMLIGLLGSCMSKQLPLTFGMSSKGYSIWVQHSFFPYHRQTTNYLMNIQFTNSTQ